MKFTNCFLAVFMLVSLAKADLLLPSTTVYRSNPDGSVSKVSTYSGGAVGFKTCKPFTCTGTCGANCVTSQCDPLVTCGCSAVSCTGQGCSGAGTCTKTSGSGGSNNNQEGTDDVGELNEELNSDWTQ